MEEKVFETEWLLDEKSFDFEDAIIVGPCGTKRTHAANTGC